MLNKKSAGFVIIAACFWPPMNAQPVNQQWLIESVEGQWEVWEQGQKPRPMGEKFEVLTPACQIRCVTTSRSQGQTCEQAHSRLYYTTEVNGLVTRVPLPLEPKLKVNKWTQVPIPTTPPVIKLAAEIQDLMGKVGVRGGAAKASPVCSGDLPLLVPACGETIDVDDFRVQWVPRPTEAGKVFVLFVGSADSSERRRWNFINAEAGEFKDQELQKYLSSLELPDRGTDVTIRLMRSESLDAVRLLRLLSEPDEAEHRKRMNAISLKPGLTGKIAQMEEFLNMGMWSKAAEISRQLLEDAPESIEIKKYALVGLCPSNFAEEIARVRNSLKEAGVTGFCETEGAGR